MGVLSSRWRWAGKRDRMTMTDGDKQSIPHAVRGEMRFKTKQTAKRPRESAPERRKRERIHKERAGSFVWVVFLAKSKRA